MTTSSIHIYYKYYNFNICRSFFFTFWIIIIHVHFPNMVVVSVFAFILRKTILLAYQYFRNIYISHLPITLRNVHMSHFTKWYSRRECVHGKMLCEVCVAAIIYYPQPQMDKTKFIQKACWSFIGVLGSSTRHNS